MPENCQLGLQRDLCYCQSSDDVFMDTGFSPGFGGNIFFCVFCAFGIFIIHSAVRVNT